MEMAPSITTSNNKNTISRSLSIMENKNNSRDVSFSSYLNGAEQTFFILNLTESNQTSNSPHENICIGKDKVQDGHEIGVFSAEKYFQGEMDDDKNSRISIVTPKIHHDKNDPIVHPKILPGTPSIRSESSWNSQSKLLTRSLKNQARETRSRVRRKSFLSNIGCNCYCKDKKSVDIDEGHIAKTEISKKSLSKTWAEEKMSIDKGIGHSREEIFSFPILGNSINPKKDHEDDKTMVSSRSLSMERKKKQSMLMWETDEEINTINTQTDAFSDNASDASSDLFEIESFSTNTNSFLARESSTCYAPSEVSIEWSVVTADYDDTRSNTTAVRSSPVRSDIQKRRQGILLGCKSQKSVNVVGSLINPPHRNQSLNSAKNATRFQPDSKIGFDRIQTIGSHNKNLLYI